MDACSGGEGQVRSVSDPVTAWTCKHRGVRNRGGDLWEIGARRFRTYFTIVALLRCLVMAGEAFTVQVG